MCQGKKKSRPYHITQGMNSFAKKLVGKPGFLILPWHAIPNLRFLHVLRRQGKCFPALARCPGIDLPGPQGGVNPAMNRVALKSLTGSTRLVRARPPTDVPLHDCAMSCSIGPFSRFHIVDWFDL